MPSKNKSNDLRSHENGKLRNISTFTNMPLLNGIESTETMKSESIDEIKPADVNRITNVEVEIIKSKNEETMKAKLVQIVIPFFLAGLGMVFTGLLLSKVKKWEVFEHIKEIIVLVPILLGLKGNLDMSLASRLSTQINIGLVHNRETTFQAILGNLTIKLLQSIVVGFLGSLVAFTVEYIEKKNFNTQDLLILTSSAITSASATSLVFGSFIIAIIMASNKLEINPDNIATPIAGSIGDIGTLITFSLIATFFYKFRQYVWIHYTFIITLFALMPFLIAYTKNNSFVKLTLKLGWAPIITSMLITSCAGIVLKEAIDKYKGIEAYQPVINGVGGNLVAIFSARLSTEMCRDLSTFGKWPNWAPKRFITYPFYTFFGNINPEVKTVRLLILLVIPSQLVLFLITYNLSNEIKVQVSLSFWLVLFYLIIALIQVTLLFIICYFVVQLFRRLKLNPDDWCIPLLTGLGDVFGGLLLYLYFYSYTSINDSKFDNNNNFNSTLSPNETYSILNTSKNVSTAI